MHSIVNILKYPILNPHSFCSAMFVITGTSGVVGSLGKVDLSLIYRKAILHRKEMFVKPILKKSLTRAV